METDSREGSAVVDLHDLYASHLEQIGTFGGQAGNAQVHDSQEGNVATYFGEAVNIGGYPSFGSLTTPQVHNYQGDFLERLGEEVRQGIAQGLGNRSDGHGYGLSPTVFNDSSQTISAPYGEQHRGRAGVGFRSFNGSDGPSDHVGSPWLTSFEREDNWVASPFAPPFRPWSAASTSSRRAHSASGSEGRPRTRARYNL